MSIYDVSRKLATAGIGHVLVAAEGDKIKVTTKLTFPKTAESMKIIETENGVLRGNTFLDNPTKLRICNAYARTLERVRIYRNFPQRPGLDITFKFRIPGPKPKSGQQISLSDLGKDDTIVPFKVELVDSHTRKPVYSLEDIVSGTVEIVEVK